MNTFLTAIAVLVPVHFFSGLLIAPSAFDPVAQATGQLWLAYLMWPLSVIYLLISRKREEERRDDG